MNNYYFDTEFIDDGKVIDLVSIGIVDDEGRELYLESSEFDESKANSWVREHVLSELGPPNERHPRSVIADRIAHFVKTDSPHPPQFIAYFADYDWVALCQLFGPMIGLPKGWPMFCLDLRQLQFHTGQRIKQPETDRHHALTDARWVRECWQQLAPFRLWHWINVEFEVPSDDRVVIALPHPSVSDFPMLACYEDGEWISEQWDPKRGPLRVTHYSYPPPTSRLPT